MFLSWIILMYQAHVAFQQECTQQCSAIANDPGEWESRLMISSFTNTSGLLSWSRDDIVQPSQYIVEYKPINTSSYSTPHEGFITEETFLLSTLEPNTAYDVRVCRFVQNVLRNDSCGMCTLCVRTGDGIPEASTVTLNRNLLSWTRPSENGAEIIQYKIKASPTSDNLLESAHLMGPIEILVAAEQMKYDLNNSQFVAEVIYKVVVTAENSVGMGPPSNALHYRKLNGTQVLPTLYRFFQTAPIRSVNGSSITANCSSAASVGGGTFICSTPSSSVLYDGNIPTLMALDENMWANELLTLQPLAPGTTTLVAFDFTSTPDYTGVSTVEILMFNCPQWGISIQAIRLFEARNILSAGRLIGTVNPSITSCDSLVRICIPYSSTRPAFGIQFIVSPNSNWVHLAEVTFYRSGRTCLPDSDVTTPTPPPVIVPTMPIPVSVIPAFYRFFLTAPIRSVNGSSITANCSSATSVGGGTFICSTPSSSVLYDGNIPTLMALDGNMWANELLILKPLQPGMNTLVAFDFTTTPGYSGISRVEIFMFNCPEWGISAQTISLLQASDISRAGTIIASIDPMVTSCESLVRVCIPRSSNQPAIGLQFTVRPDSDWIHLAEVAFYNNGSVCPPDTVIVTPTLTPDHILTSTVIPDDNISTLALTPTSTLTPDSISTSMTPTLTPDDTSTVAPRIFSVGLYLQKMELKIIQYRINASPTSDNLLESAHLTGPIEILVAAEQMKYDLNNSQFVAEIIYKVVVTAENSVGVGPPSNAVHYRKLNGTQVLPTLYRFFQTAPIRSVNGSSITANCSSATSVGGGTFICSTPSSSVLYDGNIPTLMALDGNMWANELLTLQPLAPGTTTLVAFDFTSTPDYTGVSTVEVLMFNCPQWGISIQAIRLFEARNILFEGSLIGTVNPTITSCDSLVRICIPYSSTQPAVGIQFTVSPNSNWVHLAEVTFYRSGRTCLPDSDVTTPTPPPVIVPTTPIQVIPAFYRFFLTAPIRSVNGSSITANCLSAASVGGGTFICSTPSSSVLYDGNIPTLMALDGNMWANELLTLQPLQPGISTLVAFDFTTTPGYSGISRVEIFMFNCPEWGISAQTISLLQASDISLAGTPITTVNPMVTSCESLVRVCIPCSSNQPAIGLQFTVRPDSDWIHLAEVAFYNDGSVCPPDAPTVTPDDIMTTPDDASSEILSNTVTQRNGQEVPLVTIIASAIGAVVGLLLLAIAATIILLLRYKYRSRKQHHKKPQSNNLSNLHQTQDSQIYIIHERPSNNNDYGMGLTVQNSFRHNLPESQIIPACNLQLGKIIGEGEFGIVYKGQIKSIFVGIPNVTVAIKTLKGFAEKELVRSLLEECARMQSFEHPNIMKLSGVCLDGGPAPYIIMPFMANGSLLTYLKDHRESLVVDAGAENVEAVLKKLIDISIQVDKGMEYLARNNIVHRDLAARNCMIDINFVIKVSDFGLSKSICTTKEYFRQDQSSVIKLPVKWLAPESISDGIFSEKSDVWSFGVTCWEIFSGGRTPYPGIHPSDLLSHLETGYRMKKPFNAACSDDMYSMMLHCWEESEKRPTFEDIVRDLTCQLVKVSDYLDFTSVDETPPLNEES